MSGKTEFASNRRYARGGAPFVARAATGVSGGTISTVPDANVLKLTATGAGLNTVNLLDGVCDGHKIFVFLAAKGAGNLDLVIANFHDGAKITFDTAGKRAELVWVAGKWAVISTTGTVA